MSTGRHSRAGSWVEVGAAGRERRPEKALKREPTRVLPVGERDPQPMKVKLEMKGQYSE